ncbi:hypothetical protein [Streptomyces sp. NPDC046859]|uniref:hypothetical protein n=1 Tax=Streptomyces sp. NPDC046859 TaxID=3155734 RepID=UPI0033C4CEBF
MTATSRVVMLGATVTGIAALIRAELLLRRLKGFRGINSRYEKTATSYEAAVTLASFLLWARSV